MSRVTGWLLAVLAAEVVVLATSCQNPSAVAMRRYDRQQRSGVGLAGDRYLIKFQPSTPLARQEWLIQQAGATTIREIPALGTSIVSSYRDLLQLAGSEIAYVELDNLRYAAEPAVTVRSGAVSPSFSGSGNGPGIGRSTDDPLAPAQWGIAMIRAPEAWQRTMGDPEIVVAVLDTGVDLHHPDLRNQLVSGINFVARRQQSSSSQENIVGMIANKVGPMDDNGHGTHVAGIVAAEANNAEGGAGVAPRCRIMPVKVLAYDRTGHDGDVASGIVWAVEHGARVINMSLGGEGGSRTLEQAINYAQTHGVLVCAAMGNDGEKPEKNWGANLNYPAAYAGVLAVAAVAESGERASFSNRGRWIGVAAPGVEILSTVPTYEVYDPLPPGYAAMPGTSMATPFVAGAAALLLSAHRNLDGPAVRQILTSSARDISFAGFDFATGYGLLDAAAALDR
ncbi:MAG: S8 family serine peptidase [Cyanobacteria bacterium NC_groundwater_1444_Ag_S-0.65um_54_12]|nr:S8 family serine peptidase [Cyanobacteria bacterium NC_groundwater_1444_Ag_S-0.65um_54_12]